MQIIGCLINVLDFHMSYKSNHSVSFALKCDISKNWGEWDNVGMDLDEYCVSKTFQMLELYTGLCIQHIFRRTLLFFILLREYIVTCCYLQSVASNYASLSNMINSLNFS